MTAQRVHRLEGLEPDNLLAFLALLGALRALLENATALQPRISWSLDDPPLRPRLQLARELTEDDLTARIAGGVTALSSAHDFDGCPDLNYAHDECRRILTDAARAASAENRGRADLLASLMHDAALKDGRERIVDPTPLCLLFGQGHQHFLERLSEVPRTEAPTPRARGSNAVQTSAGECIGDALFRPWRRADPTKSFRWDPQEDVRYATMPGDPTDAAFKSGTQHGANRLAAVGLAALALAPEHRAGRVRPTILGGAHDGDGFSFAWPIWRGATSLPGIAALLSHPRLRVPGALRPLGVQQVMVARRISVGKFMNFARARPLI